MAVTKQTYTATATWTASQLAGIFESAFIDAGLMSAWHDSFLSGSVENRVLEIDYGTGTYANTYYWLQFTTGGVFQHIASSWNAASDVPSGTQYLDHSSTTTNATTNHYQHITLSSTTDVTVTRYTSGVNSSFSAFLVRNGSANWAFIVTPAGVTLPSWIDLTKSCYGGFLSVQTATSGAYAFIGFQEHAKIRRHFLGQQLVGSTNLARFVGANFGTVMSYVAPGKVSNNASNYLATSVGNGGFAVLPLQSATGNTAYSADAVPVFSGIRYSHYCESLMPSDFGIAAHYANNTMAPLDKLVVTASSEEWEMLHVANGIGTTGQASIMFVARVV